MITSRYMFRYYIHPNLTDMRKDLNQSAMSKRDETETTPPPSLSSSGGSDVSSIEILVEMHQWTIVFFIISLLCFTYACLVLICHLAYWVKRPMGFNDNECGSNHCIQPIIGSSIQQNYQHNQRRDVEFAFAQIRQISNISLGVQYRDTGQQQLEQPASPPEIIHNTPPPSYGHATGSIVALALIQSETDSQSIIDSQDEISPPTYEHAIEMLQNDQQQQQQQQSQPYNNENNQNENESEEHIDNDNNQNILRCIASNLTNLSIFKF